MKRTSAAQAAGVMFCASIFCAGSALAEEVDVHKTFHAQDLKWAPAPSGMPAGAEVAVMHGDPQKTGVFALRAKFPKGYRIGPHVHDQAELLTVISGGLNLGLGAAADHASVEKLAPGDFSVMPHGVAHYALVDEDTIIQINGEGPWTIEYVNAKDDPRLNGAPDGPSGLFSSKRR